MIHITVSPILGKDLELANESASITIGGVPVNAPASSWYRSEHSPIYNIEYKVIFHNIPAYVAAHFRTHNTGAVQMMESSRSDILAKRGKNPDSKGRERRLKHIITANASWFISVAKKRLCLVADRETVKWMKALRNEVAKVDPELAKFMVVNCVYRNGLCPEPKCCGYVKSSVFRAELAEYQKLFKEKQNGNPVDNG